MMSDQSRPVPADLGLGGLGLLMQMAGGVFAALSALVGVIFLLAAGQAPGEGTLTMWFLIVTVSGVVRSWLHGKAGAALLYNTEGERPFAPIRSYLVASIVHTALWWYLLHSEAHMSTGDLAPFLLVLMVWPVAVSIIPTLPGFRDLANAIPTAEDKGFEGAAILMLVFGVLGLLTMSVSLYATWTGTPHEMHSQGSFMMLILAMLALIFRSAFHVSAGATGLRETRMDVVLASANRYCDFGVVASFVGGGLLLLGSMMENPDPSKLAIVACLVWALLVWPMTLRRFFGERQFQDLLRMSDGPGPHHRAPDLGLTTLGWFLLAWALIQLALVLPVALQHAGADMGGPLSFVSSMSSAMAGSSPWWAVGVAALQLWAAIELIRMGELHRIAASAFGVIAAAVTIYQKWAGISAVLHHRGGGLSDEIVFFGTLALELTVPLVTLFAANRGTMPSATARFNA
jgi:hypothetical protein